jgi:hypothetical protein
LHSCKFSNDKLSSLDFLPQLSQGWRIPGEGNDMRDQTKKGYRIEAHATAMERDLAMNGRPIGLG